MPLQLFFADLHSELPLQEFTPVQCTVALSAATDTLANPDVNNIAAAAAIAALDTLLICIFKSSIVIEHSEIAACVLKTRPAQRLLPDCLSLDAFCHPPAGGDAVTGRIRLRGGRFPGRPGRLIDD
jgi:hypothetical protein